MEGIKMMKGYRTLQVDVYFWGARKGKSEKLNIRIIDEEEISKKQIEQIVSKVSCFLKNIVLKEV